MQNRQGNMVSLPTPSQWGIYAGIGRRPTILGTLSINSVFGNRIIGTVNFRGTHIPINGYWDESTKEIRFNSPYASFSGSLTIFDDASIRIRHFILNGRFIITPPSSQAGRHGNWIATTSTRLTGPPIYSNSMPPVGVFVTSETLYQQN